MPFPQSFLATVQLLQPSDTASMMSVVLLFLTAVLMGPVGMVTHSPTKMHWAWLCGLVSSSPTLDVGAEARERVWGLIL